MTETNQIHMMEAIYISWTPESQKNYSFLFTFAIYSLGRRHHTLKGLSFFSNYIFMHGCLSVIHNFLSEDKQTTFYHRTCISMRIAREELK